MKKPVRPPRRSIVKWSVWLALVLGSFFWLELPGLLEPGTGQTLSELVWWVTQWSVVWFLVAAPLVWLVAHLTGRKATSWLAGWFASLRGDERGLLALPGGRHTAPRQPVATKTIAGFSGAGAVGVVFWLLDTFGVDYVEPDPTTAAFLAAVAGLAISWLLPEKRYRAPISSNGDAEAAS